MQLHRPSCRLLHQCARLGRVQTAQRCKVAAAAAEVRWGVAVHVAFDIAGAQAQGQGWDHDIWSCPDEPPNPVLSQSFSRSDGGDR